MSNMLKKGVKEPEKKEEIIQETKEPEKKEEIVEEVKEPEKKKKKEL